MAATATVHHGLIPVLAEIFGDVVLVGIKVNDDDRLAEGGDQKGQQQKEDGAVAEHALWKLWAKVRGYGELGLGNLTAHCEGKLSHRDSGMSQNPKARSTAVINGNRVPQKLLVGEIVRCENA